MSELRWNRDEALNRVAEDEELLWELMAMMVDSLRAGLDQIRAGLEARDSEAVAKAAHSLKGAAANLALEGIREPAWQAEEAARGGDLAVPEGILDRLEGPLAELTRLVAENNQG